MKRLRKLLRWVLYTVIIALIPLLFTLINLATYSRPLTLISVTEHGEMLLIASVLGAGAIGELLTTKTRPLSLAQELSLWATLVLVIVSSMWFAAIAAAGGIPNPNVVSWGSMVMLLCVIFSSGGCVYLSER
jgi:hypothetical protein